MATASWFVVALAAALCIALAVTSTAALPIKQRGSLADVRVKYDAWKSRFVVLVGTDQARVRRPENNGDTVSEGMAYGMLLAVHFNDRDLFTKMWRYVRAGNHLNHNGLMNWQIASSGAVIGFNSATDAELDFAYAMLVAVRVKGWCEFADAVNALIGKILALEVDGSVLKPGDMWGGASLTNPSYFSPAYYEMFRQHTGNQRWADVITQTYATINRINQLNAGTGLVPDWCDKDGRPSSGMGYQYKYDGCRTPWRVAMDAWYYDRAEAKAHCDKVVNFFGGAPNNIGDAYTITGSKVSNNNNAAFVGPAACCVAVSGTDAQADAYYNWMKNAGPSAYFQDSLGVITMLMVTGEMIDPLSGSMCIANPGSEPPTPSPGPTPSRTRTNSRTPSALPLVLNIILRQWDRTRTLAAIAQEMVARLCDLSGVPISTLTIRTSVDSNGWGRVVVRTSSAQAASALMSSFQEEQDAGRQNSDTSAELGSNDDHSMRKQDHAMSIAAIAGIGVGLLLLAAVLVALIVLAVIVVKKRVFAAPTAAAPASDSQVELNASNVLYSSSSL
jgi:endo-1,4-beta-D-glucanase Y